MSTTPIPEIAAYEEALLAVLPANLPHRERVAEQAARHLRLMAEINDQMNLTRIVEPREAAIKHVLDSVLPWSLMPESGTVLDIGSGAGFPGVPLALVLPGTRFVLAESIQKKARFLDQAVEQLGLPNVDVRAQRGEDLLQTRTVALITARAVAAISKLLKLLTPVLREPPRMLLYKGPDVAAELRDAAPELRKLKLKASIAMTYDLPDDMGSRAIVELRR